MVLANILAGLTDGQVDGAVHALLCVVQRGAVHRTDEALLYVALGQAPDAAQEAVGTFDAGV
ncbi:hypothetical protein D9M73_263920 [compost metagenome]